MQNTGSCLLTYFIAELYRVINIGAGFITLLLSDYYQRQFRITWESGVTAPNKAIIKEQNI